MALQLLIAKGKWRKLAKTNLNRSHTLTSHNQKNVHAWLNIWNRIHRKNSSLFFFFNKIVIKIAFTYIQQKKLSTRDYIMIHSRVFFYLFRLFLPFCLQIIFMNSWLYVQWTFFFCLYTIHWQEKNGENADHFVNVKSSGENHMRSIIYIGWAYSHFNSNFYSSRISTICKRIEFHLVVSGEWWPCTMYIRSTMPSVSEWKKNYILLLVKVQ